MERRRAEQLALGVGIAMLAGALLFRPLRGLVGRLSRDLDELTKDELYRRAQKADITGRSEMTKDELLVALKRR